MPFHMLLEIEAFGLEQWKREFTIEEQNAPFPRIWTHFGLYQWEGSQIPSGVWQLKNTLLDRNCPKRIHKV